MKPRSTINSRLRSTVMAFSPTAARSPRGQGMVLTFLGLAVLLGMVGIVYDIGHAWITQQRMQVAADAAAKAGANEIANQDTSNVSSAGVYDATQNGFTAGKTNGDGVVVSSVAVNTPPTAGPYVGKNTYVEAIIKASVPTTFIRALSLIGVAETDTIPITTRATAKPNPAPICIQSLDGFGHHAMVIGNGQTSGDVTVSAPSCDIYSDSDNNDPIGTHGGSCLNSLQTFVQNGMADDGDCVTPFPPTTDSPPVEDLLAGTPAPTTSGLSVQSPTVKKITASITLQPGIYNGGIETCNGATCPANPSSPITITFSPGGLYVMNGGGMQIGAAYTAAATTGKSTAGNCGGYSPSGMSGIAPTVAANVTLTAAGVTFYNTGTAANFKPIRILATAASSLSAPTDNSTGASEGILFFQDRTLGACSQNIVQGGTYTGTFYFEPSVIGFGGTGGAYNYFIADQIQFTSNLTINTNFSSLADGGLIKVGAALAE